MKIRLMLFLLGILWWGGGPALAGPSSKPSVPTKLLPAPSLTLTPVPIPIVIPPPPLEASKDCQWVEIPPVYNNSAPAFYGGAPMGMILGYSGCAIPLVAIPGGFYRPAGISTTKGWQWICKTDKGGKS